MIVSDCSADGGAIDHEDINEDFKPETNPAKRKQLLLVVFVVVLYLSCQLAVIYLADNIKSAVEYSGDLGFIANCTSVGIKSHVDYLERFCEVASETKGLLETTHILPTNTNSSQFEGRIDLRSHVFRVMQEKVNNSTCRSSLCDIVVYYRACNSKSSIIGMKYQLNEDNTITDLNSTMSEANNYAEFSTFVDESLEYEIVISYGVYQSSKADKEAPDEDILLRLLITGLKIVIPVPVATTLVVYYYLPQLRNLQGKIIVCKLLCELVNSFWPWFKYEKEFFDVFVCSCVAGITWTTILCYDLWSAFGDCLPTSTRPGRGRKFIRYSLVGWGHPALFTTVMFLAKHKSLVNIEVIIGIVIYVVYVFLNVLNLLFFIFTVKNIKKHNSNNLSLVKRGRQGGNTAGGSYLYFRISALMGIISFVFGNVDICMLITVTYEGKLVNGFIFGFSFIDKMLYFITLVCNTRVLTMLREKLSNNTKAAFRNLDCSAREVT